MCQEQNVRGVVRFSARAVVCNQSNSFSSERLLTRNVEPEFSTEAEVYEARKYLVNEGDMQHFKPKQAQASAFFSPSQA